MHIELTGVVLAGGSSRRMGTDKALLDWDGEPLVDRVAGRIAPACARVLIASGDGRRLGRPGEIADAVAGAGPLGGMLAAMEAAGSGLLAVVAVDMPFASGDVLRALASALGDARAIVPVAGGHGQPLHAVYDAACADGLRGYLARGERSVVGFLREIAAREAGPEVWGAVDPEGRFARNVNSPDELR